VSLVRRLRLPVLGLVALFVAGACLSDAEPSAAPSPEATLQATATATPQPEPTVAVTVPPNSSDTLVVMAPEHPTRLLPSDNLNPTEALLVDVLYDPLYRLDMEMRPVPEVAKELPTIKRTKDEDKNDVWEWSIPIKDDAKFHSGDKLKADDVTFSLRMAASHSCPLGRSLCEPVRQYMVGNPTREDNVVTITLSEPYAPFLTEVLGRLPILSQEDVKEATSELINAAGRLNENRPDKVISQITDDMLRDVCLEAETPDGCLLKDHRGKLEQIFTRARIDLPAEAPYLDPTGIFDEDAYLGDLLKRLEALAQVFDSEAQDKNSAALGLLDATVKPFGGGPYELDEIRDDGTYVLKANRKHTRSAAKIPVMEVRIERNPAVATTRLLGGEADWVLQVRDDQAEIIDAADGFRAASRPVDIQYGVLFNVRPDRVYFDIQTRRAFVQCIDHDGLATQLDDERHLAATPYTSTSWALPDGDITERDVAAANELLEGAGWRMATDGVRVRDDGTRLSTSIAVRPTNVHLFTFVNQAREQLLECGIELIVDELDLTGDAMLSQLRHPNDFDTLMWTRWLGPDPDSAVRAFESSRITSADNIADENPSGFTSALVDHFVASARETMNEAQRIEAYAQVQGEIETLIPYWPLWYESTIGAVSERLRGRDGPVDPSDSRYDWDISSWSFASES
jgi:ABC-type transport system substrate-binding protein